MRKKKRDEVSLELSTYTYNRDQKKDSMTQKRNLFFNGFLFDFVVDDFAVAFRIPSKPRRSDQKVSLDFRTFTSFVSSQFHPPVSHSQLSLPTSSNNDQPKSRRPLRPRGPLRPPLRRRCPAASREQQESAHRAGGECKSNPNPIGIFVQADA